MDQSFESLCQANLIKVKLQKLSTFNIDDIQIDDYLVEHELARFASYKQRKDALAFCVGRILTRTTLGQLLGIKPKDIPIGISEHGKPFCTLKNAPHFSISHCTNLVGLAWSKSPIGLDIESKNQVFKAEWGEALINTIEARAIQNIPELDRGSERLKLLTLKEAYLKMLGTGFMIDPKKIELISDSTEIWEANYPLLTQGKLLLHLNSPEWIMAIATPKKNS